jgi:hypothetical protein
MVNYLKRILRSEEVSKKHLNRDMENIEAFCWMVVGVGVAIVVLTLLHKI